MSRNLRYTTRHINCATLGLRHIGNVLYAEPVSEQFATDIIVIRFYFQRRFCGRRIS
jgi:hypothetical protein